jgi:tRNA nucleotidyltransferase (CCA-adding enzyme)
VVEPSTISEDLARRDFTINAIALRLAPEPAGLLDPFRGVDDTRSSLVRVLHEGSFQDDATRMLRAARYASRLDFKIARQTEALVRRDLAYLQHISGPRLRRELALLFEEPNTIDGVLLAQRLGILEAIHPALRISYSVAARWRDALGGTHFAPLDELGFGVVAAPASDGDVASLSKWLHLAGRFERSLSDLVRLRAASPKLTGARPSTAVELLDGSAPSAVWCLAVIEGGAVAETCLRYLGDWRHVKTVLDGNELQAMGVPRGQALGETLRKLRAARLDGEIRGRAEEEDMVRKAMRAQGGGKG